MAKLNIKTGQNVEAWNNLSHKQRGKYVLYDPSSKKPHCVALKGKVKRFLSCAPAPTETKDNHKPLWEWTLKDFHRAQDKGLIS